MSDGGKNKSRSSLLQFHRPQLRLESAPIPPLKPESRTCIRSLVDHKIPKQTVKVPNSRRASVLVALFAGRYGDLYVLLSQRAANLRTFPGDTSLPGGKWDEDDCDAEATARREAFEEIGLPNDKQRVPLLCIMEPFLAGGNLIVTPVVVLVLDNTIRPILNEGEVASLFSHPLISFLSEEAPFPIPPDSEIAYHTYSDIRDWVPSGSSSSTYATDTTARPMRMHRFLTGREASGTNSIKPVFGLTAAILIRVAAVGYSRAPAFEVCAPGQWSMQRRIESALRWNSVFREARWKEGMAYPDEEEEWREWRREGGVVVPQRKRKARGVLSRSRL